jgi:hypothetical protein
VRAVVEDNDWRLEGREQSLRTMLEGVAARRSAWWTSDGRDHDHCEFCWARISNHPRSAFEYARGYVTEDGHWICEPCFDDFKPRRSRP